MFVDLICQCFDNLDNFGALITLDYGESFRLTPVSSGSDETSIIRAVTKEILDSLLDTSDAADLVDRCDT